ncbi:MULTISPECIES: hypothetical protein [unclassified Streptomyces]|uniref:hypothetical protein n=1 Tax=unclassified Streptomyces TaxID=2593676 RepID=UPI0033BFCA72
MPLFWATSRASSTAEVDDGGLEYGVVGLDLLHGVLGAAATEHEELASARLLDGRLDADALVVVVVPHGQLGA